MTRAPDHDRRERALDPRHSFIVQAPAGSGKTELLVRRYLTLLAGVEAPEQILAITFTRKATAEMRRRIANALRRVKENGEPEDNPELLALADAALANDREHDWRITANTRRLRIQTIDGLCNELVRRMPWSARFGSPPEIVDDAAPFYLRAAGLTLDHIERDSGDNRDHADACAHLLRVVDADWNKAGALLAGMLEKRDKWMRLTGSADRERMEGMWREVIDRELSDAADCIPAELRAELAELGAYAAGALAASGRESAITELRDAQALPEADHRRLDQWRGLADLLLTGKDELRKTVTVTQGFPVNTVRGKAMKDRMLALLGALAGRDEARDALAGVRMLPGGGFSDEQWRSVDALMRLLPLAAAELRLLFTERNQADYIELTQRAALALGDPDNPSDLALAFDYRIGHVLMDEFQDTSSAHIDLLTRLTAGWQDGDGRTLFLVGDPMQSIYRFREAEVGNFLEVREKGIGDIRPETIALGANFRSAKALVEWFNDAFEVVMPERDDIINGAVRYAPATAHVADRDGGVRVHAAIGRDPEREAEAVAEAVEQTHRAEPEQSIAVLGRSRAHLYDIAAALRRRGVAFQAVDLEKLNERPAIRDLIALTRALLQPADRIAWLSLLRAPWCGLSLADLTALAADDHVAAIPELWADQARLAALSEEGRARITALAETLADGIARRGRVGVRRNVEAAWLRLGGPATVGPADLDDCRRYLDLLSDLEDRRVEITADSLAQAADDLWARGGADARVQLLSIHRAKGLEFDSVFLPRLDRRPRAAEQTLLRWRQLPRGLLMAPLPSSVARDDAFYPYLAHLEKIHTHNELCRLLYVACTRARKNLHLFASAGAKDGEARPPASGSLLALLWPVVVETFNVAAADDDHGEDPAADEADPFRPSPVRKLPPDWRPPALPADIPVTAADGGGEETEAVEFSWAGETARITGIVVHEILQRVDDLGWERWRREAAAETQQTRWRDRLMENGMYGPHLEDALARVTEAVENTRDDPRAAWIFSGEHRAVKTEWPLGGRVDGRVVHIIIDRTFTDPNGTRWIIDFKSGRHTGADPEAFLDREQQRHGQQMSRYANVLGRLEPGEIRLGLYFPALRGWREWAA